MASLDQDSGAVPAPRSAQFVCTGNICRSPMAEIVLRHQAIGFRLSDGSVLADHLDLSSAGTGNWHEGELMDPRTLTALESAGYRDHGHRARAFSLSTLETVDLIVCLDRNHRQTLAGLARARYGDRRAEGRLVLLRSYDPSAGGEVDVPDPYYGDARDFERCLAQVEAGCRGLVAHLASRIDAEASRR